MLRAALDLAERLGPVFPCKPGDKTPITTHGFKDATRDAKRIRAWWRTNPDANIGLVTGPTSGLLVIDVDPRNGGDTTFARLEGEHGAVEPTLRASTGGGGFHVFVQMPDSVIRQGKDVLGPGVDIKAEGGYVIVPPSVHPSGASYAWENNRAPAACPPWLVSLAAPRTKRATPATNGARPLKSAAPSSGNGATAEAVDARTLDLARARLQTLSPAIQGRDGSGALWTAALDMVRGFALPPAVALDLLRAEYNPRCSPPWSEKELRHKIDDVAGKSRVQPGYLLDAPPPGPARGPDGAAALDDVGVGLVARLRGLPKSDRSGTAITEADIAAMAALDVASRADLDGKLQAIGVKLAPLRARLNEYQRKRHAAADVPAAESWEARLLRTQTGDLRSHVANAITILRNDVSWRGVLAWDDFMQQTVFRSAPRWCPDDAPTSDTGVLDDEGEVRIAAWLLRRHELSVTKEAAGLAAHNVAKSNVFDSLVAELDALAWDRVPRLSTWPIVYCGAPDTPYTRFVGRAWMISAVARGYHPGAQVDHALILEGEQSEGKSSAIRALFADRFSESPLDLSSKDRFVNLRGVWCQSFDELAGLLKSENETAKNFLTATFDVYRPPFGRHPVKVPRRCVFGGTVNPGGVGYLKDPTGNRRYWPIACGAAGPMRLDALKRDREQLWAEAVHAFKTGEKWWPTTSEQKAMCRQEQAKREEDTPWNETVGRWLNGASIDCRACHGEGSFGERACDLCSGAGKVKPFKPSVDSQGRRYVTQSDVLTGCLQMATKDHLNKYASPVANALGHSGWRRASGGYRPLRDGVKVTAYYHPDDLESELERSAIEGRAPFGQAEPTR